LHGNFLAANVQQERLYHPPVSNDLAMHLSPVVLVVLLPIFALFQNSLTLLIVRDVTLALAAWPLFLVAKERTGAIAGIAAVILYLASPTVIAQSSEAFYLLQLAPLTFFWALRAYVRENFGTFVCWVLAGLSLREDVAIVMAGFGLWALISRRSFRWWGFGLGLPVAWWTITTAVVQPAFGRVANNSLNSMLEKSNSGPSGIYVSMIEKPTWILNGLRKGGLRYFYRLFCPGAFLGLFGLEALMAAPILTAILFLGPSLDVAFDPLSHHAILPTCALIGAATVIVTRLAKSYGFNHRVFPLTMLFFLPSVNLFNEVRGAVRERAILYTVRNDSESLREGIAKIPSGASVAAPNYALPALAKRPKLFFASYLDMYPEQQIDYFLIDRNVSRITKNPEVIDRYVSLLARLSDSSQYSIVWNRNDYVLFRRITAQPN